jgi:hypothetical protein|tara:strand:+ start:44 stop:229 length:186 start_codon:yes stop_codon:yes gene_type:complete
MGSSALVKVANHTTLQPRGAVVAASVQELEGGVVVAEVLDHELSRLRVDPSLELRGFRVVD